MSCAINRLLQGGKKIQDPCKIDFGWKKRRRCNKGAEEAWETYYHLCLIRPAAGEENRSGFINPIQPNNLSGFIWQETDARSRYIYKREAEQDGTITSRICFLAALHSPEADPKAATTPGTYMDFLKNREVFPLYRVLFFFPSFILSCLTLRQYFWGLCRPLF